MTISADDNCQSDIRQNPQIDTLTVDSITILPYPEFINIKSNIIELNGADWSNLSHDLKLLDSLPFTIVHIGDSHLQADMATAELRTTLSTHYGKQRGRGLIIPFRLAGTNEPRDYHIISSSDFMQSRLLGSYSTTSTGFTGIGIQPLSNLFELNIRTKEQFDALIIYYTGSNLRLKSAINCNDSISCISYTGDRTLSVVFPDPLDAVTLNLEANDGTTIHGINAELDYTGLAYHVIGNNGAEFASYCKLKNFGQEVTLLSPDLIIISLGTNEAFGKFDKVAIRKQLNTLVKDLKENNPRSCLLLTTPSECQRSKGRRRKHSYYVNENIKLVRDIIIEYGKDNSIPTYDWYEIAGGNGSSAKWFDSKLLGADRIHMTQQGYQINGKLIADALINALTINSMPIDQ